MIFVCVLLFTLVILIIGCVIPPAYYLGMYHDEFQQRNAEKIIFHSDYRFWSPVFDILRWRSLNRSLGFFSESPGFPDER